jgi:hypothetical protein
LLMLFYIFEKIVEIFIKGIIYFICHFSV